jgi:hypothetical protein
MINLLKVSPGKIIGVPVMLLAFIISSCAITPEYTRVTQLSFPPSTKLEIYWGKEIAEIKEPYTKIGTINAIWNGQGQSGPLAQGNTGRRSLDSAPSTPLPEIYKKKAMELGADALLITNIVEDVTLTTLPLAGVPTGMRVIIVEFTATLEAVKFQ